MEDTTTYTYRYEKENDKPEKSLKKYFAVIIVLFLVLATVIGIITGTSKARKEAETTTETPTTEAPVVTEPPAEEKYKPGSYSVNSGTKGVIFRKDHSTDAESILLIPEKTKIEVTEIFVNANTSDEDVKYWGKVKYLGHEGWVSMRYLKKEYSDNIVTPDDITEPTTVPATEPTEKVTTEKVTDVNTTAEKTTEAATSAPASKYSPGSYKVATGGSVLRFKREPGRNTEVLATLADGTEVAVLEIVEINDTDDVYRYWGKISYNGHTGYVSMAFLKK